MPEVGVGYYIARYFLISLYSITKSLSTSTSKQSSLLALVLVPEVGVEPTSLARHDFKSCAYTCSATRALKPLFYYIFSIVNYNLEAWGGIEPPHRDFADLCLTTWLPGHYFFTTHTFLDKHLRRSLS